MSTSIIFEETVSEIVWYEIQEWCPEIYGMSNLIHVSYVYFFFEGKHVCWQAQQSWTKMLMYV